MRIGGPQPVGGKGSTDVRRDSVHRPTPNPRQTSSPIFRCQECCSHCSPRWVRRFRFSPRNKRSWLYHNRDTSVSICSTDGTVTPMTTKHHAETPIESTRLRRVMGSALVTDSFGEARWMGVLENTRSLGDFKYKPFGLTPEPEVRHRLLKGTPPPSSRVCSTCFLTTGPRSRFGMFAHRPDF